MGVQAQTVGLKKARVAIPNTAIGPIPTFVAKELGYYRDEGFDTEIILMRGGVTIQALVSGSVDYTGTPGSTVAAAVQGARLLVLMDGKEGKYRFVRYIEKSEGIQIIGSAAKSS